MKSNTTIKDVLEILGFDPHDWKLMFRGLPIKNYQTLSSIEGSFGGSFLLVPKVSGGMGKRAKASKGEEEDEPKYEPMVYAPVPLENDCSLVKDSKKNKNQSNSFYHILLTNYLTILFLNSLVLRTF